MEFQKIPLIVMASVIDFIPVDVAHVLHHEPPQVLVQVRQAGEDPLQHLCVLGVQQRGDQNEEIREVRVEVSLQVSGQLHHQAEGQKTHSTPDLV